MIKLLYSVKIIESEQIFMDFIFFNQTFRCKYKNYEILLRIREINQEKEIDQENHKNIRLND